MYVDADLTVARQGTAIHFEDPNRMDTLSTRPPLPDHRLARGIAVAVLIALVSGVAWWWLLDRAAQPMAQAPVPAATLPAPEQPAVLQAPAPVAEPPAPSEPLAATELAPTLESLLGRDAVLRLLQTTDLPRHIVATVDNLARESAPASIWPVNPAAGRFRAVEQPDGRLLADPDNMLRYTPLVLLAESVDARQLTAWYQRALPALQQAYEDLGYPGQRFHDRMLVVLDHLLATPPAPRPLVLRLTEVRGPVPSSQPWLRYEFADPELEQASAGRKILWRVGPVNQRRLMKVLTDFRGALAAVPR